ncbi:Bug family tripartite tricarboxylate transporter substrate binding protein [Hydrogenophaga palleronii]|uniref:Bug family tripartite tricarboxylate transporter substrate binding protein n=1 Tax=Hydrogenophaga palleronii TaxID=65655 RepID=UPI000AE588D1|nr:tripartite tricarboxylate transporter substrate-binding protein [Hydrogenophaga palleronii]
MMQRRHFNTRLAALAAAGMASLPAMAQDGALMRIVVGFSPGGSVDAVARLLAERLKEPLGMNVIVENKPGATGRVALGEVQRARPDGRTLVLAAGGAMVIFPWLYPTNLGYDPVKDFTPISRVTSLGFVISVGPAVPVTDLKGLIAWARANPGKAMYATSGAGSVPHFSGLLLAQTLGLELTHVAYKGGPQAEQELIGGHVPMMIDSPTSTTIDLHRSGKLRILAVTGKTRLPALPDVPTLQEAGVNLAIDNFFGLYGPAGMPADVTNRIDRAVAQVLALPEVREKIQAAGLMTDHGGPQELASVQASQLKRWEAPIKVSGFKVE